MYVGVAVMSRLDHNTAQFWAFLHNGIVYVRSLAGLRRAIRRVSVHAAERRYPFCPIVSPVALAVKGLLRVIESRNTGVQIEIRAWSYFEGCPVILRKPRLAS